MNSKELMWLAGFLEGEGSFLVSDSKQKSNHLQSRSDGYRYLSIRIVGPSCDLDVLERVQSIAGGKIFGPYADSKGKGKPIYRWVLAKRKEVVPLMEALKPLMGKRRQQQIENAIEKAGKGIERVACPQCGAFRMKGHMKRHLASHNNFGEILAEKERATA